MPSALTFDHFTGGRPLRRLGAPDGTAGLSYFTGGLPYTTIVAAVVTTTSLVHPPYVWAFDYFRGGKPIPGIGEYYGTTGLGFFAGGRPHRSIVGPVTYTIVSGVQGTGGGITVWFELWRATVANALVEDLTDIFAGGEVSLNLDRAIKSSAVFKVTDPSRVEPYSDYLAVFMNREYDDGSDSERDQLGLFATRVPPSTRTIERADGVYTGEDLTAALARQAFDDAYNIAASTNYVTAVTTILSAAGFSRYQIPATTSTTAAALTFPLGTTKLAACNTLLEAIGYYHLYVTPDGKLASHPTRAVQYVEPFTTLTDDDLMRPVETQPLDTSVANVVIVIKDNPSAAPLTSTQRNDAADSPTSTVNIGELTRIERRSDLADQAAVDALAVRLLSEGRSFYQTAKLSLLPNPDVLMPHQTVDLDLTGEMELLNGRWWVRTVGMGFTPATAGPSLEVNRVTDTIEGSII